MCRLFGLTAAPRRVKASFWLLDAADSLDRQSEANPDGTGLGTFDTAGRPLVEKQPLAAYEDRQFAVEAKHRESATFLAHIRHASTGDLSTKNTHPFTQDGRIFAHNGVIEDLPRLDEQLGRYRELVEGDTDSERFFALITKHIDAHNGDVTAGITEATHWIADRLPIFAINMLLTTATELWALRYPATHDLYVLDREPGEHLEHRGTGGTVRVRSTGPARVPTFVVASEEMDDDPDWRLLPSGELLHIDQNLRAHRTPILDRPPSHPLSLSDLSADVAASQQHR
ncbi:class II glutamine amidotransferase [Nocardia amikacinitolerans]|uniref:class II glutamine amidotransferase n=1 Tax=Nocardia amikacinitolerans TaxID=756689 RepID=UPI0020A3AAD6|nr:class II glutamine amidotransferase [Nocardia amikacinitolerans]MCP2288928.1 glutamine amidotransferase [Nocardia amikacinitolerans]